MLKLCKTHSRRPVLLVLYLCSLSPDCGVTTDSAFENGIRVIQEALAPLIPCFKCPDLVKKCSVPHWYHFGVVVLLSAVINVEK